MPSRQSTFILSKTRREKLKSSWYSMHVFSMHDQTFTFIYVCLFFNSLKIPQGNSWLQISLASCFNFHNVNTINIFPEIGIWVKEVLRIYNYVCIIAESFIFCHYIVDSGWLPSCYCSVEISWMNDKQVSVKKMELPAILWVKIMTGRPTNRGYMGKLFF